MNKKMGVKGKKGYTTEKKNERKGIEEDGFETDSFNTYVLKEEPGNKSEVELGIKSNKKEEYFQDDNISEIKTVSEMDEEEEMNKEDNQIDLWMETKNKKNKYDLKKFHWKKYLYYYEDLDHLDTKEEAWDHWMDYGRYEKRFFFVYDEKNVKMNNEYNKNEMRNEMNNEMKNFDWKSYIKNYSDLKNINTKEKAWDHWIHHGKKEKRKYFCLDKDDNVNQSQGDEYDLFPWKTYINNYSDLKKLNTKEKAWKHWIKYGKKEKRVVYDLLEEEKQQYKELKKKEITKKENDFFF